jgi:acyl-CoA thioester hydrolase
MAKSDFWFFHPRRVQYAEIDAQGVVFNAHYLTYFDTALTEYMRALGYDYLNVARQSGDDFHTVRALVEFRGPVHFDDEIEVYARVARLGRSSLRFVLEIYRKGEEQLLTSGEVVWVNVNQSTHKSVPLPDKLVEKVVAREGDRLEK